MHATSHAPDRPLAARFHRAAFIASASALEQLPAGGREVAFVGRSNAGKSSAINTLTGRRKLAFVSRQPGRTQLVNLFDIGAGQRLVDLPGYGYAKVARERQREWTVLLEDYLQQRAELAGLVIIMDIRHPLSPLDRLMIDWIQPRRLPLHLLLSKADKLNRQQQARALATVRTEVAAITAPPATVQVFSSTAGTGLDTLAAVVAGWLDSESDHGA